MESTRDFHENRSLKDFNVLKNDIKEADENSLVIALNWYEKKKIISIQLLFNLRQIKLNKQLIKHFQKENIKKPMIYTRRH